jgi:phosphotransferase system enzyme I (PtsI)
VVVRTLDLGGDKFFPGFKLKKELNPYLGSRSIRLSLKYIDIFKTQIKAILRAAVHGQVKILFPMISNVEEIYRIKKVFNAAKRELEQNKVKFNPDVPFGIMIEVPAAAINIHAFLKLVDFISVGTNDLIQYTLAVDRNNEDISYLYQPFDPAILQLLKTIGMAAQQAGKSAAVCGEIAGDPLFTELLVGFGFRELSMSPPFIPHVKMRVRSLTLKNAMQSVNTIENFSRSSGIRDYVENRVIKSSFAGSEYP